MSRNIPVPVDFRPESHAVTELDSISDEFITKLIDPINILKY